jgi:hypothetical protein
VTSVSTDRGRLACHSKPPRFDPEPEVPVRLTLEEHRVAGGHDAAEEVDRAQGREGDRP